MKSKTNGTCTTSAPRSGDIGALGQSGQEQHGGQEDGALHVFVAGLAHAYPVLELAIRLLREVCGLLAVCVHVLSHEDRSGGREGLLMGLSLHQAVKAVAYSGRNRRW